MTILTTQSNRFVVQDCDSDYRAGRCYLAGVGIIVRTKCKTGISSACIFALGDVMPYNTII